MAAVFEGLIFLIVLPYVLFGVLLATIWEAVCEVFYPPLLLGGLWIMIVGSFLLSRLVQSDLTFVTVSTSIARTNLLSVPTPFVILGVGLCCVAASFVMRQKGRS